MRDSVLRLLGVVVTTSAVASCGDRSPDLSAPGTLEARPVLLTDRVQYAATPVGPPGPYRQFRFQLEARFTNPRSQTLYLQRCFPSSTTPIYGVQLLAPGQAEAAYDPAWACVGHDHPIAVAPGATRVDSLVITGPNAWIHDGSRPIGVLTGRFRMIYAVSACRAYAGTCSADPVQGVSNEFEVTIPE